MNNPNYTNCQLLQEVEQRLRNKQIGFWIENQDCYLWENTFHYSNKIKIGDLSQTKEKWWANWMVEFAKLAKERDERGKFLTAKFQEISDVELIEELKKRTEKATIKLSMYCGNDTIFIEGKDIRCEGGNTFPIEVKEKDQDV